MAHAVVVASVLGVFATWLGVLLAYDSYDWGGSHNGWPVSFFVVAVIFLSYLAAGVPGRLRGRPRPVAGQGWSDHDPEAH
jgi:zinc/manganese transport system permease protein